MRRNDNPLKSHLMHVAMKKKDVFRTGVLSLHTIATSFLQFNRSEVGFWIGNPKGKHI